LTVVLVILLVVLLGGAALAFAAMQQVRKIKPTAIDPYAVRDPWRGSVQQAIEARKQFDLAITGMPGGPMHDRLVEVGVRVAAAEAEVFRLAKVGDAMEDNADVRTRTDALVVQLREAATKVATLSVGDAGPGVLEELEALRQGIDEVTDGTGPPGLPPPP
jgi:hypothetical protein